MTPLTALLAAIADRVSAVRPADGGATLAFIGMERDWWDLYDEVERLRREAKP